jgi:pyruvate/2-oxoglutarate dehydrogenase complex dihydrolipoamide dehydrogenase (E3) component
LRTVRGASFLPRQVGPYTLRLTIWDARCGRAASAVSGFVRIIARKDDHRLLGIQAVGRNVSELSGEFAMALEMGATIEDITGIIHAHPTLSEGFFEAALRTLGHGIHV